MAIGKGAAFSGAKVTAFLREHLPADFADLRIPFGCVATDITRDRPVRFTEGDLVSAVRASISVPLAFMPVVMDDMLLIDGYVAEPVPVTLARHLGGQVVVAVDVSGSGTVNLPESGGIGEGPSLRQLHAVLKNGQPYVRGTSGFEIVGAVSEAFERRLAESALREAEVVIAPDVARYGGFEFGRATALIAAGEVAARAAIRSVRRAAHR